VIESTITAASDRLEYVDDAVSSGNYSSDIDDESPANYKYDTIGNLIYDASEQIDTIRWNVGACPDEMSGVK
jgi:hypothetical protein